MRSRTLNSDTEAPVPAAASSSLSSSASCLSVLSRILHHTTSHVQWSIQILQYVSLPSRNTASGSAERCELPSESRRSPAAKRNLVHSGVKSGPFRSAFMPCNYCSTVGSCTPGQPTTINMLIQLFQHHTRSLNAPLLHNDRILFCSFILLQFVVIAFQCTVYFAFAVLCVFCSLQAYMVGQIKQTGPTFISACNN